MMGTFTKKQKEVLIKNIFHYARKIFPGKGGVKRFAAEMNVSSQTISHWMHGRRTPNIYQIYVMSGLFDLTMQQLCGIRIKKQDHGTTPFDLIIRLMQKENNDGNTVLTSKRQWQNMLCFKAILDYEINKCESERPHQ